MKRMHHLHRTHCMQIDLKYLLKWSLKFILHSSTNEYTDSEDQKIESHMIMTGNSSASPLLSFGGDVGTILIICVSNLRNNRN